MSADNGIYIAHFPDGYRVTDVVSCIDNIWYDDPGTKERKMELRKYFGDSPVFETRNKASEYAWEIYDRWHKDENDSGMGCPIEYGISQLGECESFEE
jgi:hypothetical protein